MDNGLFWTISIASHDPAFLVKWRHGLNWKDIPDGPSQFLIAAITLHWDAHQQVLDWTSFRSYLETVEDEDTAEEIVELYTDILSAYEITESSKGVAWEKAETWIQNYHLGMALDRARAALNVDDREAAFTELLGLSDLTGELPPEKPVEIDGGGMGAMLKNRLRPEEACPTGIALVDKWWEGGVYPGQLGVFVAPTNVGKSMTLAYFAASAYRANKRVLYYSYELSVQQVGERILGGIFQKPRQKMNLDTIDDDLMKLREQAGITSGSITIARDVNTVADLKRRLEESPVDLVLLDSADDLTPRGKHDKLYESQGEVYSDLLKVICQGMNIPVWTSSQLNRESVEKARISLKHIGDSFKKMQRAHLVLGAAQTVEEGEFWMGPVVKLCVLKDTSHGSRQSWERYITKFGRGNEGWAGFDHFPEKGDLA